MLIGLKRMVIVLKKLGITAGAMILLGFSFPSFGAVAPAFDSDVGNLGYSYNFGDFTVSAWGDIDSTKDDVAAFSAAQIKAIGGDCNKDADCRGSVLLENDGDAKKGSGMGVQEGDLGTPTNNAEGIPVYPSPGGSSGISGKGQQENEQVVFNWANGVVASTVSFLLTGIDLWQSDDGDMPILYIEGHGYFDIGGNWSGGIDVDKGKCVDQGNYSCNLSLAALGLTNETTNNIAIRAAGGEFKIGAVSVSHLPIPAALPLFISALAGLGFFSRRRKAELVT